ncbi:MAG: glycosyltransferase family 4 protein, partial [Desulfobacterales bacterium]
MRIFHIDSEMHWRGGEQQVAYLMAELAALGVENVVGCNRGSRLEHYCRLHEIPFRSLNFGGGQLRAAWQVRSHGRALGIDLVHLHAAKAHSAGVFAHLLGLDAPLVLSRRTAFPVRRNPLSRFKYRYPGVRRILCVSATVKAIMDAVRPSSTGNVVVHSGVDFARFDFEGHSQKDLRNTYHFPQDSILVGSVGALTIEKDHLTFIRTAQHLLAQDPRFRLLIIGQGPRLEELKGQVVRRGIEDKVTFTGYLDHLEQYLPGLDYLLSTSVSEGFPGSLLEAMACRVPVVATAAGGIPEMIQHRRTGCLAPLGDHRRLAAEIIHLQQHPQVREALTAQAYEMVATRFSKQVTALKTYNIYRQVLA